MATATRTNGRAARVPATLPEPDRIDGMALAAAVLRVQAAAGKLIRNALGQIQHRTYTYVTLDAVTDEVLPLLVSEDLLWQTFPTALDGEPALRYRMTHVPSGEFDEDTMLLLCDRTSQGQGSGDTYARRYSLVAYLNLTVDPDDDGAAASPRPPVDRYAEQESGSTVPADPQPTARPAQASERPANAKQRSMLEARARAAGLDPGQFANVVLVAGGAPQRTWRDEDHASQTLGRLLDRLPASLVTAVKQGIGEGSES